MRGGDAKESPAPPQIGSTPRINVRKRTIRMLRVRILVEKTHHAGTLTTTQVLPRLDTCFRVHHAYSSSHSPPTRMGLIYG